jgi:asparagine synthase (glutamine-hydrolysing)
LGAIYGIFHRDGRPLERADAERMSAVLAHRAPLSTLPVAFTGRLDNRGDASDAEFVLRAYERWGEDCPRHLEGDFAFALWDPRRRALFAARDAFGVRPFYYFSGPDLFAFATEIKGLLALPRVPRRLNETRVADYLFPLLEDASITFYRDLLRLPPAHSLTVTADRVTLRRYWSLDPGRETRLRSDDDYAAAFRQTFEEAVRCRLPGRTGALLSGGLDSSSIACMAALLVSPARLPTFSAVFDDVPESDERPFIEAAVRHANLDGHFVRADRVSPLVDLERVLWHQDEPFFESNLSMDWALYGAARGAGVNVLLEGFDGDTTVSHGLGFLSELARGGRWATLAREVRGACRHLGVSPGRILLHRVLKPNLPRLRRKRGVSPLRPDFARRIGLEERARAEASRPLPTERADHARLLSSGALALCLEHTDRAAAAFGIEPRYPFFDRRLAEFCLSLPPRQKVRGGWTRWVMRRAMEGVLPPEIQWRGGKADLGPAFDRALLEFERGRLEDVAVRDGLPLKEYVDMARLRQAYSDYERGGRRQDALMLWRAVTLATWLRNTGLTP